MAGPAGVDVTALRSPRRGVRHEQYYLAGRIGRHCSLHTRIFGTKVERVQFALQKVVRQDYEAPNFVDVRHTL